MQYADPVAADLRIAQDPGQRGRVLSWCDGCGDDHRDRGGVERVTGAGAAGWAVADWVNRTSHRKIVVQDGDRSLEITGYNLDEAAEFFRRETEGA